MKIFATLLLLGLALGSGTDDEQDRQAVLAEQSRACSSLNNDKSSCVRTGNCFHVLFFVQNLNNEIPLCLSVKEVMTNYVGEPAKFIQSRKLSGFKIISKENLCKMAFEVEDFLDIDGKVRSCQV